MKNIIFAFLLLFSFTAKSQDIIGFQGFASSPIVQSGDTLKITVNVIDFSSQANGIDLGNWTDTIAIWQGCQRFPVVFKENAFGASIDLWILANPSQFSPGYCVVLGENASNIGGYVAGIDDSKNQCMLNYYLDNLSDLIGGISGVDSVITTGDTIFIYQGGQVYKVVDNKIIDGVVVPNFLTTPIEYNLILKDKDDLIFDSPSISLGSFDLMYESNNNQWVFDRFNSTNIQLWDDRKTKATLSNDTLTIIQPLSGRSSDGFTGLDTVTFVGGGGVATDTLLIRNIVSDSIAAIDINDADADPTNELDTMLNFDGSILVDGGTVKTDTLLIRNIVSDSLAGVSATDTALIRSIVSDSVIWSTNVDGDAYINEAVGIFNTDPFYPLQVGKNPALSAGSSIAVIGDGVNGMVIKESTSSNPYSAAFFGPVKFWNGSEGGGALINANDDAGTAGQVLTSQGEASTFTWETIDTNTVVGLGDFVGNNASSLWTQNGTDIYYNSGDVGIGTTSPSSELSIVGRITQNYPTSAYDNVVMGSSTTGANLTTGNNNLFLASRAGNRTTTGSRNVFVGHESGDQNIAGYNNVAVGYRSFYFPTTTSYSNTYLGISAGKFKNGYSNVGIGQEALHGTYASGAGNYNVGVGYRAGYALSTGLENVFVGFSSGLSNTTGSLNLFLGSRTGRSNTTGSNNMYIGYRAGDYQTGSSNVGIGTNSFIGQSGLSTGSSNAVIGKSSGFSSTTATGSAFVGAESGQSNTTGNYNTFLGYQSGYLNTIGNGNVFIGKQSGYNETGSNKLYIDNSNTSTPLIYGEFDNDKLTINGNATITDSLNVIGSIRVHSSLYDGNNSKGSDGQIALNTEIPGSSDGFIWEDQDQALVSTHYATLYDARDTLSNVGSIYRPIRFKDAVTIEHGSSFTVDVANDEIDIDKTGWYEVEYSISFTSDTDAEFTVAVLDASNNVICGLQQDYVYYSLSFGTMSSSNIANLLDTDVLSLEIKVTSGLVDIADINATLKIRRIR